MKFLKQFFANPKQTGAVWPSSKKLANLITNTANLKSKKCIVELGTGNGIFTQKICENKKSDTIFFAIEINSFFVNETIKNCPNAIIYNDSAENIKKYFSRHGTQNCDCIISGLPWSAFNKKLQNKLMDSIHDSLEEGGTFLTFAYLPGLLLPGGKNFHKLLKNRFKKVNKTKIIWLNFSPAFVYVCEKDNSHKK